MHVQGVLLIRPDLAVWQDEFAPEFTPVKAASGFEQDHAAHTTK